jgi:iron complex outermembrane receptor protein
MGSSHFRWTTNCCFRPFMVCSTLLFVVGNVQSASALADSGNTGSELQEIVVTAQKRAENLQDVPVPVSVLDAAQLAENNQTQLEDYYNKVPGLNLTTNDLTGTPVLFVRGLSSGNLTNPTVAVVIDDIPYQATNSLAQPIVPEIDPNDLAQVELLRGPQGTLYGASSLGGLLKYVTIAPKLDTWSGDVQVGTSSVKNGDKLGDLVSWAVNAPVSSDAAIRLSAFTRESPGYIDNVVTGVNGVNTSIVEGAHLTSLWKPSEDFALTLGGFIQRSRNEGSSYVQQGLDDLHQNFAADTGRSEYELWGVSAKMDIKIGSLDLVSITGFNRTLENLNSDLTPDFGPANPFFYPKATATPFISVNHTNKLTQEIRLSGDIPSVADWTVGAFYTYESNLSQGFLLATDAVTAKVFGAYLDGQGDYIPSTYAEEAVFAASTLHVSDRIDLQFGARESYNRQTYSETVNGSYAPDFIGIPSPAIQPEIVSNDHSFTYLVTPTMHITKDEMIYARVASGYRPGGPNSTASLFGLPLSYKADTTTNYEIGAKGEYLEHRLSIDASLYYIRWNDIQLSLVNAYSASYTANAGGAKSQGVELSVMSRPLPWLMLSGWLAVNEATLTKGFPADSSDYGVPGNTLPFAGRTTGSVSAEVTYPVLRDFEGYLGSDIAYVGAREGNFLSTTSVTNPANRQTYPSYAQTDLHLGIRNTSWVINAYCNNLTDKRGELGGGLGSYYPGVAPYLPAFTYIRPRTIGLTVRRNF